MSFFVTDDRFSQHRKVQRLCLSPYYAPALAVWLLAGSWCVGDAQARDTGQIPTYVLAGFRVPEWELAVKALIEVGLWEETDDAEVVMFHDWDFWSGPNARARRLEKRLEDDRVRQQRRRSEANAALSSLQSEGWSRDQPRVGHVTVLDGHVKDREVEGLGVEGSSKTKPKPSSRPRRNANEGRADAMRLCTHLADRIEGNGSSRPTITGRWLDAARLLIDVNKRTEEQVHKAIDWCQDDEFWRANVMSMPTLRDKYDTLRLRAKDQNNGKPPPGRPPAHHVEAGLPRDAPPPDFDPIRERLKANDHDR